MGPTDRVEHRVVERGLGGLGQLGPIPRPDPPQRSLRSSRSHQILLGEESMISAR